MELSTLAVEPLVDTTCRLVLYIVACTCTFCTLFVTDEGLWTKMFCSLLTVNIQ